MCAELDSYVLAFEGDVRNLGLWYLRVLNPLTNVTNLQHYDLVDHGKYPALFAGQDPWDKWWVDYSFPPELLQDFLYLEVARNQSYSPILKAVLFSAINKPDEVRRAPFRPLYTIKLAVMFL